MSESKKITLTKEQWEIFITNLRRLSKSCRDADIVNGVIRQRSKDSSMVIEMDMTSFLGDSSFVIRGLFTVADILMELSGEVVIEIDEEKISYSDGYCTYNMKMIKDKTYLDDKYMSKQEFDSSTKSSPSKEEKQ